MSKPVVHFIGIGGIGTSALARWYLAQGYAVSGSDLAASATTRELADEGVRIFIGHDKNNMPADAKRVIFNQAIPANNPELVRARELGTPTLSYPQSVGELTKLYKTVAIAGAHGKSTTTALVALILLRAKLDPTVIVGTKLKEFGSKNFRLGKSDYLVIEADEWRAAFLHYFPYAALVTNIDREHLDFYKNLRNVKQTFTKFLNNVHPYGLVVLNKDDKNLFSLKKKIKRPVVWYSIDSKDAETVKKIIKIPGTHNLSNATGAYTLCRALGIKKSVILSAISRFAGAWRRSEFRGHFRGADVYDDYGHHPTEIKATLAGFREKFPEKKIICVFQPHQRERLKILFKDFVGAFDAADELVLLEIYTVAGRDPSTDSTSSPQASSGQGRKINSEKLARAVMARRARTNKLIPLVPELIEGLPSVPVCATIKELKNALKEKMTGALPVIARSAFSREQQRGGTRQSYSNSIIVMMGAGNIYEWTDKLVASS